MKFMPQKGLASSAHFRRILGTLIHNSLKIINKNRALNAFWDYLALLYIAAASSSPLPPSLPPSLSPFLRLRRRSNAHHKTATELYLRLFPT